MNEIEQEKQKLRNINLPIDWHIPEDIKSQYVTNAFVQVGPNEIFLSFFEAQLPLLTGTPEENSDALEKMGKIKADCIGKFVVAPDLVPSIIAALQSSLDAYRASKETQSEEVK